MLDKQLAHGRWATRETIDHCLDRGIAELGQEIRLPIVERAFRKTAVEGGIELVVGNRPDPIHHRSSELVERLHRSFCLCKRPAMTGDHGGYWRSRAVGRMRQRGEQDLFVG